MNIVRQHNLMIVNEARKHKSSVKIIATGGLASQESAEVFKWLMRRIEYQSNAQAAYQTARWYQVYGGIGWCRLVTDYAGPDTFEQEIYIRPIEDPLSVYMDPHCKQKDCSDGKRAVVFDLVPKRAWRRAYPELADLVGDTALGTGSVGGDWAPKDCIIVAEYFRKVSKPDKLYGFIDPTTGMRKALRGSQMPKEILDVIKDDPQTIWRPTTRDEVEWYLIVGEQIVDSTIWPGKYIPLMRCIGEETIIEGMLDRKGHTRAMIDAQRMFNYNASASVEFGALQTKTPWTASKRAVEGQQSMWETANQINHSVLVWNDVDESNPDQPIAPPQRVEPPQASPAFENGMETAFKQMMMTSGQWMNEMGMAGNERTGVAIQARQEQSSTSVFHFQDNYGEMLRYIGKQVIDLVPRVYDTKRIIRVLTDDGEALEYLINPGMAQAYAEEKDHQNQVVMRIFNPAVGQYDIAADVGPEQLTKRQEAQEMLTLILTQNPALTGLIGDLLLADLDFDKAQEAARRLRNMVPKEALGEGPTQQEQMLGQQVQALSAELAKTMNRAAADRVKLVDKSGSQEIDSYKAETDRMKALADMLPMDSPGLEQMIEQLVKDALATHLTPIIQNNLEQMTMSQDQEAPPIPGAQKAPDGAWYLTDPTRQGKYLRVVPLAQEHKQRGVIANA